MHCAACSASVEKVTRRLPGVERSDVNLTTGIMTICYDEGQVSPEQITAKVEKAGFGCTLHAEKKEHTAQSVQNEEEAALRRKKLELIVSAVFSFFSAWRAQPKLAFSTFAAICSGPTWLSS